MTTTDLVAVLLILAFHWFSDFILQTDKQAIGKSSSNVWLLAHVSTYTLSMTCLLSLYSLSVRHNWQTALSLSEFAGITFVSHFVTDYVTSRINSRLWQDNKRHEFFVCIGMDQLLHYIQLFITYKLLF